MAATAGITLMIAGGLTQANAYQQSGRAAEKVGEYNAQVDEIKAKDAEERGRLQEFNLRTNTRKLIGSQRAAFAASGVDISDPEGTAQNVFADTAKMSEMDALTIRTNAAREAWGFRSQATQDRYSGKLAKYEGDQKAIGALLSTGGNVLFGKYGFK